MYPKYLFFKAKTKLMLVQEYPETGTKLACTLSGERRR
jgi:hypothetical protein